MLKSNVLGYNNSSGILYNEMNGMRQYKGKERLYPRDSNVYPMYENTRNVETLLKTMNDGKSFFNKGGLSKIPDIPNRNLEYGGFKNKGDVIEQDDQRPIGSLYNQPKRIKISKEAKRLASQAVSKLPITPEQRTTEEMKTLNKFNSFLSKLNRKNMPKQGETAPNGRAPNNWFRGAIDVPPPDYL